jgi:hypothetical protein
VPRPYDRIENKLFASLSGEEYERIRPHLERISLSSGKYIYEPGKQLKHLYFPTTCIISLIYTVAGRIHGIVLLDSD